MYLDQQYLFTICRYQADDSKPIWVIYNAVMLENISDFILFDFGKMFRKTKKLDIIDLQFSEVLEISPLIFFKFPTHKIFFIPVRSLSFTYCTLSSLHHMLL